MCIRDRTDVASQIDSPRKSMLWKIAKKLLSIVKTVILCGRQKLPLRGHRDHGPLSLEELIENDGNFRALLQYRIDREDEVLRQHASTCSLNALYLSYKIQNDIEICEDIIYTQLLDKLNETEWFCWWNVWYLWISTGLNKHKTHYKRQKWYA